MTFAGIMKHVIDGLWLAGGIGAAADLSMEDFGPGAGTLSPSGGQPSHCSSRNSRTSPGAVAKPLGRAVTPRKRSLR